MGARTIARGAGYAVGVATTFFRYPYEVGIVAGTDFPDGISGSAQMSFNHIDPLLLSDGAAFPASTLAYLTTHKC